MPEIELSGKIDFDPAAEGRSVPGVILAARVEVKDGRVLVTLLEDYALRVSERGVAYFE